MIHHDLVMIRQVIHGFPKPLRNTYLPRIPETIVKEQTLADLYSQPTLSPNREHYTSNTLLFKFIKANYTARRIERLVKYIELSYARRRFHPESRAAVYSELVKMAFSSGSLVEAKRVLTGYTLDNPGPFNTLITQLCLNNRIKESVACM
jgi:hypothetical protein